MTLRAAKAFVPLETLALLLLPPRAQGIYLRKTRRGTDK